MRWKEGEGLTKWYQQIPDTESRRFSKKRSYSAHSPNLGPGSFRPRLRQSTPTGLGVNPETTRIETSSRSEKRDESSGGGSCPHNRFRLRFRRVSFCQAPTKWMRLLGAYGLHLLGDLLGKYWGILTAK